MTLIKKAKEALEGATPGPWGIVPYDAGDRDEWAMWTPLIDGSKEADRAVVHWAGFRQRYWQSAGGKHFEIKANAQLIALAPDLARALIAAEELAEFAEEVASYTCTCDEGFSGRGLTDPSCRGCEFGDDARTALAHFRKAVEGKE